MGMTVKQFYVSLGTWGDWNLRRKIEKAVFSYKISWQDVMTDKVRKIIAETQAEQN